MQHSEGVYNPPLLAYPINPVPNSPALDGISLRFEYFDNQFALAMQREYSEITPMNSKQPSYPSVVFSNANPALKSFYSAAVKTPFFEVE